MEGINKNLKVRKAVFAGSFYPFESDELLQDLSSMFKSVKGERVSERVLGLLSPHAGYIYSGQVAAEAYNQIKGREYETVVIIAPSHREYFMGASVYGGDVYETPLGGIKIDKELAEICTQSNEKVYLSNEGHGDEHSLEVQLPFLQFILKEFKILPIVMGDQSYSNCTYLGMILGKFLKERNVLVVASSDLSHFHNYDTAVKLDNHIINRVNSFDPEGLSRDLEQKKCEACGAGPMMAVMYAAKLAGAKFSKVLSYKNSGDVTGDKWKVVGYLSAVIYGD